MTELHTLEHDTLEPQLSVAELLLPEHLPEAGFQSYESLKNNAAALKDDFINDRVANPDFEYSALRDLATIDKGILRLHEAIEAVRRQEPDEEKANIIASSLHFRIAEMEYVKLLARLDFVTHDNADEAVVRELAEETRALGEQLYGTPDEKIRDATRNEIWRQLDAKAYHPSAQKLYDELANGFTWQDREIAGLPRPDNNEQLPDFEHPSIAWTGEVVLRHNADIKAIVDDFWSEKVAERGDEYVAHPQDMVEAFEQVLDYLDPEGTSGVGVLLDTESAALSWETPLMAVKIGGKAAAHQNADALFQKIMHELRGHGGRAISGLQSELPVLGTGLYTDTPRADYLTFEEGFLTTVEKAIGDDEPVYVAKNLGHYANISLFAEGADFREVYETAWRWRTLLKLQNNEELTDAAIRKEKAITYTALVRVARGTPITIKENYPAIKPLSFNKDLAYLNGRVLAMDYLKQLYETNDEVGLVQLFDAKYDPTIPEQAAIVKKYLHTQ